MAEVLRLEELTSPRLAEILAHRPVGLWPVGAVEPHGPHAPLGTDTLIATGVCERAAARLEEPLCVVFPALPVGVTRYGASFAGALGISEETLTGVVRDLAASAAAQGFRRLAVVNCHFEPEQVQTLRAACAQAGVLHLDLVRRRAAERLTEEFRRGSCHAGRYETSLILADRPELIDRERMADLPEVPVDMPRAMAAGARDFPSMGMPEAYCGAPAEASAGRSPDVRDPDRAAGGVDPGRRVSDEHFNLASWFVDRHVSEGRGDRVALYCGGRRVSYAQLSEEVARVGNVLHELGVRQEERVLLVLADGLEFVASWYGAQKVGAVTAEVYTFLPAKDLAYYLDYTRAGVVIVDASTLAAVRAARAMLSPDSRWPRVLLVVGAQADALEAGEASYEEMVGQAAGQLDPAPTGPDDIALWKFTTGSTGLPKACVHRTVTPYLSFQAYARGVLDMSEDDVVLPVPKLFFGYARDLAALYPFGVGAAGIVFPQRPTPELLFDLAAQLSPTILVNVPTMIRAMLEEPGDLSSLRLCTSAGEALPVALHERWRDRFGVELLDGIGSSEAYHIYISSRPGRVKPGRLGETVPGYRARVVDEDGIEMPDGETGRLWVTGDTTALMYWEARGKSVETYAGDTVMSGDLFARHADGFFEYRGRADDMLKVGGIWVAPQEIERCLASHPDVVDCAVVGFQQDGLELPRAFVVLRSGAEVEAGTLQSFVKSTLSPHKFPREVRFLDDLPRTGSGKVDRRALRQLA